MIPLFKVHMPPEVDGPLLETLHSGYIGQGPRVDEFEAKFARTIGVDSLSVLSVNSGTSALTLALRLAGVEGGEVITTPMTCMATNTPILDSRATPVWADVDPDTGLIDPEDVHRLVNSRTRAIIAVDWGGTACDYPALTGPRPIIRDAAHALGAPFEHIPQYTAYSFQAIKHITTGDGGVLVANWIRQADRGRLLRWYGIDRNGDRTDFRCEIDVPDWGYKFHMNDLAATIGLVQLDHLDRVVAAHRENAAYYLANLPPGIRSATHRSQRASSAFWLFTVLLNDAPTRDRFMAHMISRGIQVSKVHARMDGHTVFRKFTTRDLPGVTAFYDRECCIPVHWAMTPEDREQIVTAMHEFAA